MLTVFSTVLAQEELVNLNPTGQFANLGNVSLASIINALVILVLIVAAIVFFFMLIIGGVRWIASGGDKGQIEAARGQITAALIGLLIVFAAWAVINLIELFFDIEILTLNIESAVESTAPAPIPE